ncbi:MAG TPA: hypothetical protein VHC69_19900 [Polyangiaceae bacterium]|nr:hypothetical protein [Polyangiaceae bacterium]
MAVVLCALTADAFADASAPQNSDAPAAPAAPAATIERHVLGTEDSDVIVDLTVKDGVKAGDDVELWRPLRLVHPVTHKVVVDRYRIATLRLVQVHDAISLARPVGTPLRPPAPGDIVVAPRPAAAPSAVAAMPTSGLPAPATAPAAAPSSPAPAQSVPPAPAALAERGPSAPNPDAEAAVVASMFNHLLGASLIKRIRRYELYAQDHPNSPYVRVLLEEAAALRELVSLREHAEADALTVRHFDVPEQTLDRVPLMMTVELSGQAEGAVLQVRVAGERTYRAFPMTQIGPKYFSATIPPDRVLAPRIEYFVEAVREDGASVPVAGSADAPLTTAVHHVPHPELPTSRETTVTLLTDYADYNRLRGNDHTWQTEGAFSMRLGDVGVRSFGGGFGVYRGVGGSIDDLDTLHLQPRSVGLTYGYVEGEFGINPTISLIARAMLGLRDIGTAGGAQLHVRIGSDLATNLRIGGEVLGGVGLRGILELDINPRSRIPVMVRSEVTNQPAGSGASLAQDPNLNPNESIAAGDVGVRGIVQVGYRFVPPLMVALRASYQGRTISHAGPGLGGAVEYRW